MIYSVFNSFPPFFGICIPQGFPLPRPGFPFLNFNLQTCNLQTDHATCMVILSESASRRNFFFNVLRLHSNDIYIIILIDS